MIALTTTLSQSFAPADLPAAVRAALGKPLRRAAPLTQLALVGALACLPAEHRALPTALLWQSTSGPRLETMTLLDEVCSGSAEPMPYDFLATQPAIAAAQIQSFLPGLQSAMHLPLDSQGISNWSLLLSLAIVWLNEGRCAQVLCAQLDHAADAASGHWLALRRAPLENSSASLQLVNRQSIAGHSRERGNPVQPWTPASAGVTNLVAELITEDASTDSLPDTPDFPARLAEWLSGNNSPTLSLHSPVAMKLTVEFTRL